MDVREKLMELICRFCSGLDVSDITPPYGYENLANFLISNGVTMQELDGCDFCKKFDFAGAKAEVNKYGAYISLTIYNTKFPNDEQFKFCPMCGRRLPQLPEGE